MRSRRRVSRWHATLQSKALHHKSRCYRGSSRFDHDPERLGIGTNGGGREPGSQRPSIQTLILCDPSAAWVSCRDSRCVQTCRFPSSLVSPRRRRPGSSGGLHSTVRAVGCATSTGFAASAGAEAAHALSSRSNHPTGADHIAPPTDSPTLNNCSRLWVLNLCCAPAPCHGPATARSPGLKAVASNSAMACGIW